MARTRSAGPTWAGTPALVAASALLVDYVLTVAVSVAAGVANIVSALPSSAARRRCRCPLGWSVSLAVMNLRGVKESGTVFAIPTYGFILCVFAMIGVGLGAGASAATRRSPSRRPSASAPRARARVACWSCCVLRAFASGCTALTGVEAVSNGVPSFRPPKSRNAAATLAIMGGLTVAMFVGITALALVSKVHVADDPAQLVGAPAGYSQRTVIAQIAGAVFGVDSIGFFAVQGFTAAILILAANTAFNGFPILASILGEDGYLPRQFARRGDRLVFSNGIVILAGLARADLGVRRLHHPADPALHHRRVRLVHPEPGRHGAALAAAPPAETDCAREAAPACARSLINGVGRRHHGAGAGDRADHEVHPRRLDRGDRDAAPVRADAGIRRHYDQRRRRAAPAAGRGHPAEPDPRGRAGVQAAHAHAAGAGVRPRDPARTPWSR